MKKLLGVLLLLVFMGCESPENSLANAVGGDGTGNGGDGVVAEFREYAQMAVTLARHNNEELDLVPDDIFDGLLKNVLISSTSEALLGPDALEKDALNYPQRRVILVQRERWLGLKSESFKMLLALHEFLGVNTEIDDSDYFVSSALLKVDVNGGEAILRKVDILFVIDESGSMFAHQSNLKSNIDVLVERIRKRRIDYHIGITTTSTGEGTSFSRPYGDGRLAGGPYSDGRLVGNPSFVTMATPDGLEKLKDNILVGTYGSAIERPFEAIYKSFTLRLDDPENKGFYRRDADLEIVILTDAFNKEMDGLELAAELIHFKGNRSVSISSFLVLAVTELCKPDLVHDLEKYLPIHQVFTGAFYDLCRQNYSEDLLKLADQIAQRAGKK